jgi:hypothetical protein
MGKIAFLMVLTLCMLGALTGCQSVGLTGSFCDPRTGIEPFRTTAQERAALSSDIKRNMLRINNYGAANCGWRA